MFSFRYHGNYAGPGWSAGKYQKSVAGSSVPAIDEFDETAKEHDAAYALGKDLKKADYKFFKQNFGKGFKRSVAALAVGAQGYLRCKFILFLKKIICHQLGNAKRLLRLCLLQLNELGLDRLFRRK